MSIFTGTLHPFQDEGVAFLTTRKRALLADDVGLGKTIQIAAAIGGLWPDLSSRPGLPVLYVTAASLVPQTVAELQRWLPSLSVVRADRKAAIHRTPTDLPDILVTSHELVHSRTELLLAVPLGLVVVDEASALKGGKAEFESVRTVCDQGRRVIAATATPFENHPLELWTVLELLGNAPLGDQDDFLDRYCRIRYFNNDNWKVEGWKSDDRAQEAMERISRAFLRRTANEVAMPLPVREDTEPTLVPLTSEQSAAMRRAGFIRSPLSRHARQAKIARGIDFGSPLLQAGMQLVRREVDDGRRVVVYTEYLDDLKALSQLLDQANIGHVTIEGATTQTDRADAVAVFRNDPNVPVLLGSRVLEYGHNLQFANTLISIGVTYNPARERQREGRLRRIGSPHASYRHLIVLPDTALTREQLKILSRKAAGAQHVLRDAGPAARPPSNNSR